MNRATQPRPVIAAAILAVAASTMTLAAEPASSAAPAGLAGSPELAAVPMADPGSTLSPDWRHGPFMEVYVRGYQDSNGDGDGDLRGLISRLDYLKGLGVRGIWLMPVQPSQDHDHGYAPIDYRGIEPDYGTLADFDELLKQAHARGIGVIMDYVMNHSGVEHPLFVQSSKGTGNPWRDWYVWQDKAPSGWSIFGRDPWYETDHGAYFAGFWSEMPEFNLRNPKVVAWHHDNLRFWLNRGVDGIRFDAVGNLVENGPLGYESQPESKALMKEVRQLVDRYANRYMVCEAPGDPTGFGSDEACGSAFAFGHQNRLVTAGLGSPAALEPIAEYFKVSPPGMASFASNHDAFAGQRLMDRMRGDEASYRMVAATYLLQPGTPFLYYGEEIGMAGATGASGDHKLRPPMSWTGDAEKAGFTTGEPFRKRSANIATHNVAAEEKSPGSLLNFYRQLIALRQAHPALFKGSYERPVATGWTMSFQRAFEDERLLVVYNFGSQRAQAVAGGLPSRARLVGLWPAEGKPANWQADGQGVAKLTLAPQSFQVWRVEGSSK